MSLLPYSLARSVLFRMDAETAHEHTISMLEKIQHTPLRCTIAQPFVHDPVQLYGLTFPNRVGLAAGLDKNARCLAAWEAMGFGFVEVGTVTPRAQPGNPKPRMFRLPQAQALINRLGFNNEGLDVFLRHVQRHQPSAAAAANRPRSLIGLNIGKNASTPMEQAASDYLTCLDAVYPHADYITVNISSPNTQNLRSLQGDAALDALLDALMQRRQQLAQQHGRSKPLFIKIAPDLNDEQIQLLAATLRRYGCDSNGSPNQTLGVIATNTTISRDAVSGLPHADETGGLSGAPVRAASNRIIIALRSQLGADFAIIGVGGVMDAADAPAKLQAGAQLVQIMTGLIYHGPQLVHDAARACQHLAAQTTATPASRPQP